MRDFLGKGDEIVVDVEHWSMELKLGEEKISLGEHTDGGEIRELKSIAEGDTCKTGSVEGISTHMN